MVKQNPRAHLSMLAATLLFGANYWIAKGLMPSHLLPMQIIFLRVLGTFIIAMAIQFSIKELRVLKIDRADYPRLILSSLLGVAINQMMFFTFAPFNKLSVTHKSGELIEWGKRQ